MYGVVCLMQSLYYKWTRPATNAAIGRRLHRGVRSTSENPTTCTLPSDVIYHNLIHHQMNENTTIKSQVKVDKTSTSKNTETSSTPSTELVILTHTDAANVVAVEQFRTNILLLITCRSSIMMTLLSAINCKVLFAQELLLQLMKPLQPVV